MDFGVETLLSIPLTLVVFILSLTVHEWAHARVALWLGDDTAAHQGRLTLSPLPHIDPIGTLLMPIMGSLTGVALIGWARPVPVTPTRFTRKVSMRAGMALVAAAGPASNLLMAVLSVALIWFVFFSGVVPRFAFGETLQGFLLRMAIANVGLALFNLLPIPPLDGSRLMPRSLDGLMEIVQRYSFIFFLLIIFAGGRFLGPLMRVGVRLLFGAFGIDINI